MTELENRKAQLIEIINGLTEDHKYIIHVSREIDADHVECTSGVNGSLSDVINGVCSVLKDILISRETSALEALAIAKKFSTCITEACAEASAEVMNSKTPDDAASDLNALLMALLSKQGSDEDSDDDSDECKKSDGADD